MFKWLYSKYLIWKLIMNRIERLVSVQMDVDYFQSIVDFRGSEDFLRKQLAQEREKDVKEQNLELIGKLQESIDIVEKANASIVEYNTIAQELDMYLSYLRKRGAKKIKDTLDNI